LLPSADLVSAGLITLPSYDLNLFLNGILQAFNGEPVQGSSTPSARRSPLTWRSSCSEALSNCPSS
jgi:hypothetical protein